MAVRPWLNSVLSNGGPRSTLLRHDHATPLVRRTVHAGSGMAAVGSSPDAKAASTAEYERLARMYGRIPW